MKYTCEGTCGGVSDVPKSCETEGCSHEGQPLVKQEEKREVGVGDKKKKTSIAILVALVGVVIVVAWFVMGALDINIRSPFATSCESYSGWDSGHDLPSRECEAAGCRVVIGKTECDPNTIPDCTTQITCVKK